MKTVGQSIREAIQHDDTSRAEAILVAALDLNPVEFVGALRSEGALRFARYDFRYKTLLPLVELILSQYGQTVGAENETYLSSVLAFGELVPEIRSRLRRIKASLNTRSFKSYLATVDQLFREEPKSNIYLPPERIFASWRDFSKEELADAVSYYRWLLQGNGTPDISDLNHIVTSKVTTSYYLDQLAELAKIIHFKEAEMLVAFFPYRAITSGLSIVVQPENDEFEKCIRWGYIRHEEQSKADTLLIHSLNQQIALPNQTDKVWTMSEIAARFIETAGDDLFEVIEGQNSRVRFCLPISDPLKEKFSGDAVLLEEYCQIEDASKSLFITFDQIRSTKIDQAKLITLHDIIRFQRLCRFISVMFQEFCRRKNLLGTTTYFRSLIPHFTEDEAFSMARDVCGIKYPREFFEVLCADPSETSVLDVQYRPVQKVAGQYLIPIGLLANSNVIRNALQATRFRFDASDDIDPVSEILMNAFNTGGAKAVHRVKYSHGEIDVMTVLGDHLFCFECKNSLHPCNIHELRQSYGYIANGFEQLTRFRKHWKDGLVIKQIRKATGFDLTSLTGLSTCVVTGNRMLNGYELDGHSVRSVYELSNVVAGGDAKFTFPRSLDKLDGPKDSYLFKSWSGQSLQASDLIDYLGENSLPRMSLNAMVEHDYVVPFGRKRLRFRSFAFDASRFFEMVIEHDRTRMESTMNQ